MHIHSAVESSEVVHIVKFEPRLVLEQASESIG
jgi:hypothetical protein